MAKIRNILDKKFFARKTLRVAPDLLGKYLVRKVGKKTVREKITEVEAYVGPHDLASHSSKGRTLRTEVMYAEAGTIYIYFIYGMYFMLNIVTEEKDFPAAILIRATETLKGPGVLTRELAIDKNLNGKLANKKAGLWFEDTGEKINVKKIKKSPRIGVNYAGPVWSAKKYRFTLEN
jgi:DNA-3-methyladenine glycosylase